MCDQLDPHKSYRFGKFTIGLDKSGELAILADHDLEQPGSGEYYLDASPKKIEPRHMNIRRVRRE